MINQLNFRKVFDLKKKFEEFFEPYRVDNSDLINNKFSKKFLMEIVLLFLLSKSAIEP